MPFAKINNVSLYYDTYGDGAPLVLIAGLGSDSMSWFNVIEDLSRNNKLIVFDNRGCGRSDYPSGKITIEDMAEDTVGLLEYLKIDKANILGHSMGGYIAQEIAIKYPERVNNLILVSTAANTTARNKLIFKEFSEILNTDGYSDLWFKSWIEWLFTEEVQSDTSFIDLFISNALKYPYLQKPSGFDSQVNAINSYDCRSNLPLIKAKTFIISGSEDILITPENSLFLSEKIPDSTLEILNNAAHSIQVENPKAFSEAVLKFQKSLVKK